MYTQSPGTMSLIRIVRPPNERRSMFSRIDRYLGVAFSPSSGRPRNSNPLEWTASNSTRDTALATPEKIAI